MGNIIEFKKAGIKFREKWIFRNADIIVRKGDKVVLLGSSGGGKSVFLKLCLGLLYPSEGKIIRFGGSDISLLHKKSGVLFQNDALFESLSIRENILFGNENLSREDIIACLKKVNLDDINQDDYPSGLSGGMRKRLALARALVLSPEVLFIDEPTSGLDPSTSKAIIDLLASFKDDENKTLIIITHDPYCADSLADRILFINKEKKTIEEIEKENFSPAKFNEIFQEASLNKEVLAKSVKNKFMPDQYINGFFALIGAGYINFRGLTGVPDIKKVWFRLIKDAFSSLPFVIGVCLLIGFLLALQAGSSLMKLGVIGWVPYLMTRSAFEDLGFLLIGFLLCGRTATSFCAEVWKMNLGNELDAIRVMGKSPQKIILQPYLLAFLFGLPIVYIIGEFSILFGGAVYSLLGLGGSQLSLTYYLSQAFDNISITIILINIIKAFGAAFILSIIPMTVASETDNPLLKNKNTPIPTAVVISMTLLVIFNIIFRG